MTDPTQATPRPMYEYAPDTDLLLRFGHLPDCGESAEFPWDCTCQWREAFDNAKRAVNNLDALLAALRALVDTAEEMDDGITEHGWAIEQARAVLAKVEQRAWRADEHRPDMPWEQERAVLTEPEPDLRTGWDRTP